MTAISKLIIHTKIDNEGFETDAVKLANSVKKLGKDLGSVFSSKQQKQIDTLSQKFNRQTEAVSKQSAKVSELKKEYEALTSGSVEPKSLINMQGEYEKNFRESEKLEKKANELQKILSRPVVAQHDYGSEQVKIMRTELQTLVGAISTLDGKNETIRQSMEAIKLDPTTSVEAQKFAANIDLGVQKLGRLKDEAKTTGAGLKDALDEKQPSRFAKAIKTAAGAFGKVAKVGLAAFGKIGKGAIELTKKLFSTNKAVSGLTNRLGGLIKTALVFTVIRNGLNQLRKYLGGLVQVNSQFVLSLNQIKGNLMTGFQPILEFVMPAINLLMAGLSKLTGYIARFTSSLFGKTFEQSKNSAKNLNKQAEALKDTGKAAKQASKDIAQGATSIDELNVISKDSQSDVDSSGGGASAIEDIFNSLEQQQLKMPNFLEDILAEIKRGNWFSVGELIAKKINETVAKINWKSIGEKIGTFFQGTFSTAHGFLKTIDTQQIGAGIATLINNVFKSVDPRTFGGTFAELLNRIVDLFYGFATETDWSGIATWLGEAINGFFTDVDWGKLGGTIGAFVSGLLDMIVTFIQTTDWAAIGAAVFELLAGIDWGGVVRGVIGTLANLQIIIPKLIWGFLKKAWESVVSWWHDEVLIDGEFTIQGLLQGILNGLKGIGSWIWKNMVQPIIDAVKSLFGIRSPSTVFGDIGENMIEGLKNGVTGMITSVINTFTGLWRKIKEVFSSVANWFRDIFSDAWQNVKDVFSKGGEVFAGIKDGILSGLKTIINALIGGINTIIKVPFDGINFALNKIKGISIAGFKPFSWMPTITTPQIPKLAGGAVIPANKEFAAILGDQRHGTNLETPEDLLRQIFREESGNGALIHLIQQLISVVENKQTNVHVGIGERDIAKANRTGSLSLGYQVGGV